MSDPRRTAVLFVECQRGVIGDLSVLPALAEAAQPALAAMARLAAWAASGKTVIASLHDLTLAARYAGRILALRDGRMTGEGALTAAMVRDVFGVEARVRGEGRSMNVDFLAPVDPKEDF